MLHTHPPSLNQLSQSKKKSHKHQSCQLFQKSSNVSYTTFYGALRKLRKKYFKSFLFFTAAPVAVEVQAAIPEPVVAVEEVFVAPAPVVERK